VAKRHSKPTGLIGSVVIPGDGQPPEFRTIKFPSEKADAELFIVKAAVSPTNDLGRFYKLTSLPAQDRENGFDFLLQTPGGIEHLELMEIAPLSRSQGSYSAAPLTYNQGQLADAIFEGISKKSQRYGGPRCKAKINLLLYSTDFRFRVSNDVLWLIAKWASLKPNAFKSVVYVTFLAERSIEGKIIFPQPGLSFEGIDEEKVRNNLIMLADFTQLQSSGDGLSVTFPLGGITEKPK
jgi:hypothetical protein